MKKDPFKEYIIESNPTKKELGYSWYTAIGLQKVDGLETSDYLKRVAIDNIEGDISFEKAEELIRSYYIENEDHSSLTEEADKVSINIAKILSEKTFNFSPAQYLEIHRRLFSNVFDHAGEIRTYNITKKEWVLDGDTVLYGSASSLNETLEYDFNVEKSFDYSKLNTNEFIHHMARFIADLWQIHVFPEGNTRTTAVFFIKYLRTLGFDATNDIFAEHAWYFRNALVRANYTDLKNGVHETTEYLELFLKNLLLNEKNELHNRTMHVSGKFNNLQKADIGEEKADIGEEKTDIAIKIANIDEAINSKTRSNILALYQHCGKETFFGRTVVESVTGLKSTRASEVLQLLLRNNIIEKVQGHGKGKYRFL